MEKETVSLRLFRTEALARQASLEGIHKLIELALSKDFAWLHRDLRELNLFDPFLANLIPLAELQETAYENLKRHLLPADGFWPLREEDFLKAVQATRLEIPGLAQKLVDQVGVILRARKELQARCGPAPLLPALRVTSSSLVPTLSTGLGTAAAMISRARARFVALKLIAIPTGPLRP